MGLHKGAIVQKIRSSCKYIKCAGWQVFNGNAKEIGAHKASEVKADDSWLI
jgi:hypothetical protein